MSDTAHQMTPADVGDWAKTLAAVAGVVGGAVALVSRWWKRRLERRRIAALEAKALRYLLDAVRHALFVMAPGPDRFLELDELERQKVLIDEVRDEVWKSDGHGSRRDQAETQRTLLRILTRTQAIQAKAEREAEMVGEPPMFDKGR